MEQPNRQGPAPLHLHLTQEDDEHTEDETGKRRSTQSSQEESSRPSKKQATQDSNEISVDYDAILFRAAERGDFQTVKEALIKGADKNVVYCGFKTPVHVAATGGHIDIVRELIAHEADINLKDKLNVAPLQAALENGHSQVAEILLSAGASLDNGDFGGFSPLHEAARKGALEFVRLLLKKGAELNRQEDLGRTPLDMAAEHHHHAVVRLLLRYAAQSNHKSDNNAEFRASFADQPLLAAVVTNDFIGLNALTLQPTQEQLDEALVYAVMQDRKAIVVWLLDKGANARRALSEVDTMLHPHSLARKLSITARGQLLIRMTLVDLILSQEQLQPNLLKPECPLDLKERILHPVIVRAILKGKLNEVREAIWKGANVNSVAGLTSQALIVLAALYKKTKTEPEKEDPALEMVTLLLIHGAATQPLQERADILKNHPKMARRLTLIEQARQLPTQAHQAKKTVFDLN
jgi:ankyrin repeat protein